MRGDRNRNRALTAAKERERNNTTQRGTMSKHEREENKNTHIRTGNVSGGRRRKKTQRQEGVKVSFDLNHLTWR